MALLPVWCAMVFSLAAWSAGAITQVCILQTDPHILTFHDKGGPTPAWKDCLADGIYRIVQNSRVDMQIVIKNWWISEINYIFRNEGSPRPICKIDTYDFEIFPNGDCTANGVRTEVTRNTNTESLSVYFPGADFSTITISNKHAHPRHFNIEIWMNKALVPTTVGFCNSDNCHSTTKRSLDTVLEKRGQTPIVEREKAYSICDAHVKSYLNKLEVRRSATQRNTHYNSTIQNFYHACVFDVMYYGREAAVGNLDTVMIEEMTADIDDLSQIQTVFQEKIVDAVIELVEAQVEAEAQVAVIMGEATPTPTSTTTTTQPTTTASSTPLSTTVTTPLPTCPMVSTGCCDKCLISHGHYLPPAPASPVEEPMFTCPDTTVIRRYRNVFNSFRYWQCTKGVAERVSCPNGLVFSEEVQKCDWEVPFPNPCVPGQQYAKLPAPLWLGRSAYIKCNSNTGKFEDLEICKDDYVWVPSIRQCLTCNQAHAVQPETASSKSTICPTVTSNSSCCDTCPAMNGFSPQQRTTTSSRFICPEANGLFQNIDNLFTFWSCANGIPHLMNCPSNLVFSQTLGFCDWGVPFGDPCRGGNAFYPVPRWFGPAIYIQCDIVKKEMKSINICTHGRVWIQKVERCGSCLEAAQSLADVLTSIPG